MTLNRHRFAAVGAALVIGSLGLTACGANDAQSGGSADDGGDGGGGTIALLLPESKTTRYEAFDKPLFEGKVADLCGDCTVDYYNADQDAAKQQQQVTSAISKGAEVVVLDPVDGNGAGGMVASAQDSGAQVIAYDRFIEGADYYMSFDNERVGQMQAETLVESIGGSGSILMLNGAPTDPNAAQFKAGAHSVFDSTDGLDILAEFDNPDWSPEEAQKFTTDQLGKNSASAIDGIYAANDGQAGGVVAALTGSGVDAGNLPPITGQDAELAGIQRIVAGEQAMTIYKPIKTEAEKAAEVAVALLNGEDVGETEDYQGVASFIFDPVVVTQDNVKDTVVADGFYDASEICTSNYAQACQAAGLS